MSVNRGSSVGIATGYGMAWVRFPESARFVSSYHANRLWGPLSVLSNGYRGALPGVQSGHGVKLTTQLYLMPR
jgi:hypothetical protein